MYGKGTGIKGHDAIGADLCDCCHKYFDQYESYATKHSVERSEEFLHLCAMTVIRRIERGVLK
jgi:hypothetical protein